MPGKREISKKAGRKRRAELIPATHRTERGMGMGKKKTF